MLLFFTVIRKQLSFLFICNILIVRIFFCPMDIPTKLRSRVKHMAHTLKEGPNHNTLENPILNKQRITPFWWILGAEICIIPFY